MINITRDTVEGIVTTIERSDYKVNLARQNFARSDLTSNITLVHDDANQFLQQCSNESCDFIFLDAERTEYPALWPHLQRLLRAGGLLAVDNATSHAMQMAPFFTLVRNTMEFTTSQVSVGNGEFLAVKSSPL